MASQFDRLATEEQRERLRRRDQAEEIALADRFNRGRRKTQPNGQPNPTILPLPQQGQLAGAIVSLSRQTACMWFLAIGLGLFGSVLGHPIAVAYAAQQGGGYEIWPFTMLMFLAMPLAICGAYLGYCVFLLLCDVSLEGSVFATPAAKGRQFLVAALTTAVLGSVLQSSVLDDYFPLAAKPMPAFSETVNADNQITLEQIPRDGRLIRVALVEMSNQSAFPYLQDTFPRAGRKEPESDEWTPKPIAEILTGDSDCKGEVWVSADEVPQVWTNLPNGLLEVVEVSAGRIRFRVRPAPAGSSSPGTLRLVALVYDSIRSAPIKAHVQPEGVEKEVREKAQNGQRVFEHTVSPLVRAVWGPEIPPAASP